MGLIHLRWTVPAIYIDGDITWNFKKISSDQKDQSLDSDGAKPKDTIEMDEPVSQRTRHKIKLQHLSEPRTRSTWTKRIQKSENYSFY
jgi:hypothetical protein